MNRERELKRIELEKKMQRYEEADRRKNERLEREKIEK